MIDARTRTKTARVKPSKKDTNTVKDQDVDGRKVLSGGNIRTNR